MDTYYLFFSDKFLPTPGELDEEHEDYINPGVAGKELADFMEKRLLARGYKVGFRCPEDWGHWLELEHEGGYTLSVGCTSDVYEVKDGLTRNRVFIEPNKPFVRKWFRKIDVRGDVERLSDSIRAILTAEKQVVNIHTEELP